MNVVEIRRNNQSEMTSRVFGGIEGGATGSRIILMDEAGRSLCEAEGESSNYWLMGLQETCRRLASLVAVAKQKAGLPSDTPLTALGMSLSGAETGEPQHQLEAGMKEYYPLCSESYAVSCDTWAPIATACTNGGMVLISGTGSNCELINLSGSTFRCGGWGHMMGDEGSAYWISYYCVKRVFDTLDQLDVCTHDISTAHQAMKEYFAVEDLKDMLPHLYSEFKKCKFAGLCKHLASYAEQKKDPLCQEAFYEAGRILGRHITALAPKLDKESEWHMDDGSMLAAVLEEMMAAPGGVRVICVGSVWKSWSLLKDGFMKGISHTPEGSSGPLVSELTLLLLKKPASYGAAYLGAKKVHCYIASNLDDNAEAFFHHKF